MNEKLNKKCFPALFFHAPLRCCHSKSKSTGNLNGVTQYPPLDSQFHLWSVDKRCGSFFIFMKQLISKKIKILSSSILHFLSGSFVPQNLREDISWMWQIFTVVSRPYRLYSALQRTAKTVLWFLTYFKLLVWSSFGLEMLSLVRWLKNIRERLQLHTVNSDMTTKLIVPWVFFI